MVYSRFDRKSRKMQLDFYTSLITSRLCHDLIAPLGAIRNASDLVTQSDPQDAQDLVRLIQQSAHSALTVLKIYRVAFGASGQKILPDVAAALELIKTYAKDHHTKLKIKGAPSAFTEESQHVFAKSLVQVIYLLTPVFRSSDQTIIEIQEAKTVPALTMEFLGKRLFIPEVLKKLGVSQVPVSDEDLDPINILTHLTNKFMEEGGIHLTFHGADQGKVTVVLEKDAVPVRGVARLF
jgi:hypothetical protein